MLDVLSSLTARQEWLSPTQRDQLLSLLLTYADVFAEGPHDVGRTDVTHSLY